MRIKLKRLGNDKRYVFTAVFARFGFMQSYKGYPLKTVLLTEICLDGQIITDHLWFTCGKRLASMHLAPGEKIVFEARVAIYYKYNIVTKEKEIDYKLAYPTKIKKI